jgi:hypothetical protein
MTTIHHRRDGESLTVEFDWIEVTCGVPYGDERWTFHRQCGETVSPGMTGPDMDRRYINGLGSTLITPYIEPRLAPPGWNWIGSETGWGRSKHTYDIPEEDAKLWAIQ